MIESSKVEAIGPKTSRQEPLDPARSKLKVVQPTIVILSSDEETEPNSLQVQTKLLKDFRSEVKV